MEAIIFQHETPEQRENRLKEAEARKVETRKRVIEALKRRREEFDQQMEESIKKAREEMTMGIPETGYWEHPHKVWLRKHEERCQELVAQGHIRMPDVVIPGFDGPSSRVERIHPGTEVEKMIRKTSGICFED